MVNQALTGRAGRRSGAQTASVMIGSRAARQGCHACGAEEPCRWLRRAMGMAEEGSSCAVSGNNTVTLLTAVSKSPIPGCVGVDLPRK